MKLLNLELLFILVSLMVIFKNGFEHEKPPFLEPLLITCTDPETGNDFQYWSLEAEVLNDRILFVDLDGRKWAILFTEFNLYQCHE